VRRVKLIPDKEYLFTHRRIRTFRAVFKRIVRAPATDTMDEYYYECEVDSALSRNPWNNPQEQRKALMLLRPSLITIIQDAPKDPGPGMRSMATGSPIRRQRESWTSDWMESLRSVLRNLRRS
jgi:hypothetical protein